MTDLYCTLAPFSTLYIYTSVVSLSHSLLWTTFSPPTPSLPSYPPSPPHPPLPSLPHPEDLCSLVLKGDGCRLVLSAMRRHKTAPVQHAGLSALCNLAISGETGKQRRPALSASLHLTQVHPLHCLCSLVERLAVSVFSWWFLCRVQPQRIVRCRRGSRCDVSL